MLQPEEIARFCPDVDATVAFYEKLLGVQPVSWQHGATATFLLGNVKFFFDRQSQHEPGGPLREEDHIASRAPDVDRACRELTSGGLTVAVGPQDFYWGRSADLRDPDGRLVELHQA